MIGYEAFAELSQSYDSDERGQAAHMAALAYLDHDGPADEHAALYAALIGFLDDTSVKVRAALAYGLLHSPRAPRPIILSLLQDSAVISRAVLQYSPVLVDADLLPLAAGGNPMVLTAISQRGVVSAKLASALLVHGDRGLVLRLLRRREIALADELLCRLAREWGGDAQMRGALLGRDDLPGAARLLLVGKVAESLKATRIVKGALGQDRLNRVVRNSTDSALAAIGDTGGEAARLNFVGQLVAQDLINTRLLLHAVVTGRVMFFAACIGELADTGSRKVLTLLESGSRAALLALFARCGLSKAAGGLLARIVIQARMADLADDVSARHYVITVLTEELLAEFGGNIPDELLECFSYLNEQNIALARQAARGVVAAFAKTANASLKLPSAPDVPHLQLPAA
ncbi:DUF2336 domain-containing protein [Devosia sp. XK-2]|uniref:DUF2336 domain-containing protein n=1 Tax=Devosia sp. XK-2 TaxID=3126689 RepID=UPI0030D0D85B